MSFVESFYSFNLDFSNADSGLAAKVRVKTPRHPYEPLHHLYARMLAFMHAWHEGLQFSEGLYNEEQPTMWERDIIGAVHTWIEVGCPERKKLLTALRSAGHAAKPVKFAIYFYAPDQLREFCTALRGSRSNWVEPVSFYLISPAMLEALLLTDRSSSSWTGTIVDNHVYLDCDGQEIMGAIEPVDIWREYQESLSGEAP